MQLQLLPSWKIDKEKWDACIDAAKNGLIYSTYIYLQGMCDNWAALILNDYEAVMPLPWRKKFGIKYIYPPAFTQQMGITSIHHVSNSISSSFFAAVPARFRIIEMNCNCAMPVQAMNVRERKNYLLDISAPYSDLKKAYSRSAKRNIQKALNNMVIIKQDVEPEAIIRTHRERFKDKIGPTGNDYKKFNSLTSALKATGQCITWGAFEKGQLIAGSIYFLYKERGIFIFNGNTTKSLANGATHLLKDTAIKHFAEKGTVHYLDFEGSDNPNFSRFYNQFGADKYETYFNVRINRLPFPLRLLKR